jgi:hypothetical protein
MLAVMFLFTSTVSALLASSVVNAVIYLFKEILTVRLCWGSGTFLGDG